MKNKFIYIYYNRCVLASLITEKYIIGELP